MEDGRNELLTLLEQWQAGILNERQVHEQAEALMDELGERPSYPEHNPKSIAAEILLHLDALNHQLITPDDIPAMQVFLRTPLGNESEGWVVWKSYWNKLDLENRRQRLESNPYYCT